ncbi:hypothetical protein M8J75_015066 [Diaphorina citri]|jgi:hypothetical protein|nr:hypothetical protein M8J75_015066 [Diaphorina citri]
MSDEDNILAREVTITGIISMNHLSHTCTAINSMIIYSKLTRSMMHYAVVNEVFEIQVWCSVAEDSDGSFDMAEGHADFEPQLKTLSI